MIDQNKIQTLGPLNPKSDNLPIILSDGSDKNSPTVTDLFLKCMANKY